MVANATDSDANKVYALGENLGMAFQLQDDYLDVFGDTESFGKERGGYNCYGGICKYIPEFKGISFSVSTTF